ncbi:MAG: DUF445 family protein [Treponema sp.]|jgi:uncharacterized membrane protein YheB (UPF0754 family)|nr:DUF445 family protein [Treponema sp.]
MKYILLFSLPPIAGAIIGYVTNTIAIKMLFRPLKEIRVFGIRLPFTPGLLPKQRKKLAVSIGSMVERELLTPDIIRLRLTRDEVRKEIREALSHFTASILEKNPSDLMDTGEISLASAVPSVIEKLYPGFTSAVMDFLDRNETRREFESKGRILLRSVFDKLNSFQRIFLSAAQYDLTLEEKMPEIIDELVFGIENLLNDNNVKMTLINSVSGSFSRLSSGQDKTIAMLLDINENNKKRLDDFLFEKLMNTADSQIEFLLSSIDIKTLVSDRIDSLDMLRVERIILDVMADQFKWINIFGGILGFLIGSFQAIFSWILN